MNGESVHAIEWFDVKELGRVCIVDTATMPQGTVLVVGQPVRIDCVWYLVKGLDRAVHGTRVGVVVAPVE